MTGYGSLHCFVTGDTFDAFLCRRWSSTFPPPGVDRSMTALAEPTAPARQRPRRPHHWADVDPSRRGLVLTWLAFTVTFGIARIVTGVIKLGGSTTGDATVGGVHLHHYLWGILLLIGVALFGLVDRSPKARAWMGVFLGIGLGLVVDEAALLITLKDVYWHTAGWSSIGIAIVLISVAGTVLVFTRSGKYEQDEAPRSDS